MPDFNDKELDKLFQEAADHIRPEFDEQDWDQLSARLDLHDDKGILYRSASLYGIVILLLIFTARNVWKEYYGIGSTSGISVNEIPHRNSNSINSKHVNIDSIESGERSKIAIKNDAAKTESKSTSASLTSSQESSSLTKTENELDESQTSSAQKVQSKESKQKIETSRENNKDLQKDNKHSAQYKPNQATSDTEIIENTGDSFHDNARDLNKDIERSSSDNNKQNGRVTHSALASNKNNNAQTSDLNKNKEVDALDTDKGNINVMHSDASSFKKDDAQISDLNKKEESGSLNSNKQAADVSNSAINLVKEDSVQAHDLNKDTDKQSRTHFIHSEVAPNRKDSTQAANLNKEKNTGALQLDKQNMNVTNSEMLIHNENGRQPSDLNKDKEAASLNTDKNPGITHPNLTLLKSDSTLINDSTKIQKDKLTQLIDEPADDSVVVQTEVARTRNLFIKLPISPDFTSVGYSSLGNPGINLGLLLEYAFNKNIAVEAGAIWSKKLYDAHYAKVNSVKGDCRILDLPINVKYYLTPGSGINFFVTAGFSSYVMLREKYDYVTITANNTENHWSREYSRKNNEWFSMLNFSIGAQRQVSKRLWLQAEPFFKAPIAGVGAVNIKLVSVGAFLTLKYKIK